MSFMILIYVILLFSVVQFFSCYLFRKIVFPFSKYNCLIYIYVFRFCESYLYSSCLEAHLVVSKTDYVLSYFLDLC